MVTAICCSWGSATSTVSFSRCRLDLLNWWVAGHDWNLAIKLRSNFTWFKTYVVFHMSIWWDSLIYPSIQTEDSLWFQTWHYMLNHRNSTVAGNHPWQFKSCQHERPIPGWVDGFLSPVSILEGMGLPWTYIWWIEGCKKTCLNHFTLAYDLSFVSQNSLLLQIPFRYSLASFTSFSELRRSKYLCYAFRCVVAILFCHYINKWCNGSIMINSSLLP